MNDAMATQLDSPMDAAAIGRRRSPRRAKLGELFQYTVGNVTLPRQKSAMLPIITDGVEIERAVDLQRVGAAKRTRSTACGSRTRPASTCCRAR